MINNKTMKTKIIESSFKLTYIKELNKKVWINETIEEIATFNSKKDAINYLKKMKKHTFEKFDIKGKFTNANNYNEYEEKWGNKKFHYKIVKTEIWK